MGEKESPSSGHNSAASGYITQLEVCAWELMIRIIGRYELLLVGDKRQNFTFRLILFEI